MGGSTSGRPRHRERRSPFQVGVLVLMALCFALRCYTASRWTWVEDDWVYMARAHSMGFWGYLCQNYNGHLMPGQFAVAWLVTHAAPLRHGVAVVIIGLLSTLSVRVWASALQAMFGERSRLLIPLALLTLTPLGLPPSVWWASALQMLPLQMLTGASALFAAQWSQRQERASLVRLTVTFIAALLFWEKALLVLVPVLGVVLFCSSEGPVATLRRARHLLIALVLTAIAYIALYRHLTAVRPGDRRMGINVTDWPGLPFVLRFYRDGLTDSLIPALLGGPWGSMITLTDRLSKPSHTVIVVSCVVSFAIIATAVRCRRRAWLPICMVLGYALLAATLVLLSNRVAILGDLAIQDQRYTIDIMTVACLGVAMLMTPALGESRAMAVRREPARWLHSRAGWAATGSLLAVSLILGNTMATVRAGVHPGRSWVNNLLRDVDEHRTVMIHDAYAPNRVLTGAWWLKYARLAQMLSPLGSRVSFDDSASTMYVVGGDGHLRPAVIAEDARAPEGPVKGCGYALSPGQTTALALNRDLVDYEWGLEVTAYAGHGGTLMVHIGDRVRVIPIKRGFARHQVSYAGPVREVSLSLTRDSSPVCVTDLHIGSVGPVGGS